MEWTPADIPLESPRAVTIMKIVYTQLLLLIIDCSGSTPFWTVTAASLD